MNRTEDNSRRIFQLEEIVKDQHRQLKEQQKLINKILAQLKTEHHKTESEKYNTNQ